MVMQRSMGLSVVLLASVLSAATSEAVEPPLAVSDDNTLRVFLEGEQSRFRIRVLGDGPVEELLAIDHDLSVQLLLTEVDAEAAGLGDCVARDAPFGVSAAAIVWRDGVTTTSAEQPSFGDTFDGRMEVLSDNRSDAVVCDDGCEASVVLTLQYPDNEGCAVADLVAEATIVFQTQEVRDTNGLIVVIERMDDESP